jgi:hypothetical protein
MYRVTRVLKVLKVFLVKMETRVSKENQATLVHLAEWATQEKLVHEGYLVNQVYMVKKERKDHQDLLV